MFCISLDRWITKRIKRNLYSVHYASRIDRTFLSEEFWIFVDIYALTYQRYKWWFRWVWARKLGLNACIAKLRGNLQLPNDSVQLFVPDFCCWRHASTKCFVPYEYRKIPCKDQSVFSHYESYFELFEVRILCRERQIKSKVFL